MDGLTYLSDAAADALSKHKGLLTLNGLSYISEAAASGLGRHIGHLELRGLKYLSLAAAELLCLCPGSLYLDLTELSKSAELMAVLNRHPSIHAYPRDVSERTLNMLRAKEVAWDTFDDMDDCFFCFYSSEEWSFGDAFEKGLDLIKDAGCRPIHYVNLREIIDEPDEPDPGTAFLFGNEDQVNDRLRHLPNRILTVSVAEAFLKDSDSLDLKRFGAISPEAAELLRAFTGDVVDLSGLQELSDAAAESLSMLTCEELLLDGLSTLTDNAAESLSQFSGTLLLGVTSLSDSAAASLSRLKGNFNDLLYFAHLGDGDGHIELAERFGRDGDGMIAWPNIREISPNAAGGLVKSSGFLHLGLRCLSDATAEQLSGFDGDFFALDVTNLTEAAATSLAKCRGGLCLSDLITPPDTVVERLSKKNGELAAC